MPVDSEGNITTTKSVNVKTLHDVMQEKDVDVVPLFSGGMARVDKDAGDGAGIKITSAPDTP